MAPNNIGWHVRECGSWLLLHASPPGAAAALSRRERQVAEVYGEGLSHKEIARRLGSSPSTVRTQLQSIYRRLGVHSRTELQRAIEAS
jgi:DNA-binding NarL/FixJ family response regulator